jgi:hypothetical protein
MKLPTLSDLTRAELLALIALMPAQPSRQMIGSVRVRTLNARAQVAAAKSQALIKQLPDPKAWEDYQHAWSKFQRLRDEADALLEAL